MIFIAEDDKDILELYKLGFNKYPDVQIEVCQSGNLAAPRLVESKYTAIILDLKLPGVNGMQLVCKAKEGVNRNTPIFIVSGFLDDNAIKIAQNLGVLETISKPFDAGAIAERIYKKVAKAQKPYKYDVKLINFFVEAAIDIFGYYFKVKPDIGPPQMKPANAPPRGGITAVITITGNGFTGSMALSTGGAFVKNLAGALFPEQNVEISKEFAADIMGEMCNQIIGKVKLSFVKAGQNATIGLPSVIIGKEQVVYHKTENPILFLPITIGKLHCDLEFCFSACNIKIEDKKDETQVPGDMILF